MAPIGINPAGWAGWEIAAVLAALLNLLLCLHAWQDMLRDEECDPVELVLWALLGCAILPLVAIKCLWAWWLRR